MMPTLTALSKARAVALLTACMALHSSIWSLDLADAPLFLQPVPGNLALTPSVEWPTATSPAYLNTTAYNSAISYYGLFDPDKCYRYTSVWNAARSDYSSSYFAPYSMTSTGTCTSTAAVPLWSGNYMNWVATQSLDAFRKALTGGNRSVDTTSMTILDKAYYPPGYGSHQTFMPDKVISSGVSGVTPFSWASATTRLWGGGLRMWITGTSTVEIGTNRVPPTGAVNYVAQTSLSSTTPAPDSSIFEVYIRVKVCDSSVGLETNCVTYGSTAAKPEGLMQRHSDKLRYAAFGYLNDSSAVRDGGVMRARMKFIGPTRPVPGSATVSNSAAEWDATTGIMLANPDASDASATQTDAASATGFSITISNSGAMNYLNKFSTGMDDPNKMPVLKSFDPVSELYYTALRYFRNKGNVPSYSSLADAPDVGVLKQWLDGFPVIQTWDDPIAYTCQRNFILGIGDVNSWNDANLPGSVLRSWEPALPSEVTNDTEIDVKTATDMVGQLEGIANLGSYSSGHNNSYYIAGLAYDAHTRDIRPDLSGTQTVATYWVDVLEKQTYLSKNQYWLATKYGGFTIPTNFDPYASSNGPSTLTTAMWSKNGRTLSGATTDAQPDNYFTGEQGAKIASGLSSAFARIVAEATAVTSTAFASATLNESSGANRSYAATYDPTYWSGNIIASSVTYASDGTPGLSTMWEAQSLLDAVTPSNRKIVTCCTSTNQALAFTSAALSAATLHARTYLTSFANVPGVSSSDQSSANFIAYLRGDRSQEVSNGGPYRTRGHVLGDIVNSKVMPVGAPSATYHDLNNPGYGAFKAARAGRKTIVYAGANDGMLHAFDGTLSGTGAGAELFAYIPSFLYGTSTTAASVGLAALGNPEYSHRFYVDGSPQVVDVDFSRVQGATASSSGDWRSLLVGGLGKGGRGYYAIDVTDPSAWTSESAVAGKVLWEFTDSTMGYTYGDARIVKTAKYGWTVILTSGYNNADGKGYIYFVNPKTGALLERVATPTGSTTAPIDLAHVTTFIPDLTDYTASTLYAGDMQGNLWRMDISGTGAYAAPTVIAQLRDASGAVQPVSSAPRIMIDPSTRARYVMIGTGRLLSDSELTSTQRQTVYAIVDGTAAAFYTSSTLPTGASFPITRSQLNANTSLLSGIGSSPGSAMGWYYDLGVDSSTGIAERVTVTPTANLGVVGVAVSKPNGQTCSQSASSYVIAVNYATGQSVLTSSTGSVIANSAVQTGMASDIAFKNIAGKLRLVAGRSSGTVTSLPGSFSGAAGLMRLNWRSVPMQN